MYSIDWSGAAWLTVRSLTQLCGAPRRGRARDPPSSPLHSHTMQLPEPPPPPLAPLWDRVLRAQALPPDLDVQLLYIAIRDRLTHPEWEVRLHALRVLADLLPLSGNALAFPFDQVVDNLGHNSPNVRKAALDALKVFCTHCEDSECAARAILDKCAYQNIRPHSANIDTKVNVITGLILSIPSVMNILKKRHPALDVFPMFQILGDKLFDPIHRDVAQRALLKLRRVCGPRDYMISLSRLDLKVQDKFRQLCETYDEDSMDVYYAPRKAYRDSNNQTLVKINHVFNAPLNNAIRLSTDSSSEESFSHMPFYNSNYAKVIIETEIKFDSDTAITMTVLEENETESEKNTGSEEDCDSSDRNMLKYSDGDGDSEDTDVVVKKVRFGGESVKIRTPDSENLLSSEDDHNQNKIVAIKKDNIVEVSTQITPMIVTKMNEIRREAFERELHLKTSNKKSGIPLPVIHNKVQKRGIVTQYSNVKLKSKSLSELYDYFSTKNDKQENLYREGSGFALTLSEVRSPDKVPSPVEPHREVEVLHNLQRSPTVSPRRHQTRLHLERDGFVLNLLASSPAREEDLPPPRAPSPLRTRYDWEELSVAPPHVLEQLHNTENWIAVVKAVDQLHGALLERATVRRAEPAALSLVQHMWALSEAVNAARAPAEGAVCALVRNSSNDCLRQLLPALVSRMAREPLPAALPQALLQRLALHHLVDLVFDGDMIGVSGDPELVEEAQLRATLCLSRAAGPAAVLSAVRRRLAGSAAADSFCTKLREKLSRPVENIKSNSIARSSQLPVAVRRRARSTPPPAAPAPPRRLRPLPDSAPLPGVSQVGRDYLLKPLSPIPLSDRDSSAYTSFEDNVEKKQPSSEGERKSIESVIVGATQVDISTEELDETPLPPRSPSIKVEDYSERSHRSSYVEPQVHDKTPSPDVFGSQKSLDRVSFTSSKSRTSSRKSPSNNSKSRSVTNSPTKSRYPSPDPTSDIYDDQSLQCNRDVRNALAECIVPPRHEDWEVIVNALIETERLASDAAARAPAATWRAATRATAAHVRSLRSRVARTACSTLGALFEHRGRALDPELEEAATALLDRCADVNRFLRADAAAALVRLACGSSSARAAVALCRRGAAHRAGPVRAAAAQALARLVQHAGAGRALALAPEPRTVLLRAAGELLADAHADARVHARHLCLSLAADSRFRQMLKEAMLPSRYRAIEKFVDKLR
ncbi:uncharacterized protein LOC128676264 [Plodia interpunctella]|uniref:uncharacterized protein LOC128676264 n=1 Tax=Plodia interpunctella TaxID=58824 RepID=UPI002368D799|nr:uncharacterized protein LOC128676264 [Plodia interpunctella]